MVFAGVGLFCAPVDWIHQYLGRPRSVITKSEFITRARVLAVRAKELRALSDMLKRQDREGGRNRKWRANFKRLQTALYTLEEDEYQLDRVFPQARAARRCPASAGVGRGDGGARPAGG